MVRAEDESNSQYTPDFFLLRGRSADIPKTQLTSLLRSAVLSTILLHFTELFFGDSYQDHLLLSINYWISSTSPCTDTAIHHKNPRNSETIFWSTKYFFVSCCCRPTHIHSTPSSWDEWEVSCENTETTSALFEKVRRGCCTTPVFEKMYACRAFVWSLVGCDFYAECGRNLGEFFMLCDNAENEHLSLIWNLISTVESGPIVLLSCTRKFN